MKSRAIVALSASALVLAACGGGGGGKQDEVADMVLEQMEDEDVTIDEDCVRDAAGELSDEDAQKILDAGPDGEADDLSSEAQAAGAALVDCIDFDSMLDEIDTSIPDITIPDITIPDITMPDISIPDVSMPDISIPDVSMPDIDEFLDELNIEGLDEECFRAAVDDFEPGSGDADELMSAALDCIDLGG